MVEDYHLKLLGSYKTLGSQALGDHGSGGNGNYFGGAHSSPAPDKMGSELSEERVLDFSRGCFHDSHNSRKFWNRGLAVLDRASRLW